ncbi:MAG: adenylate/guanylate cyclase domain-containing protein [Thermodesulfobacteriota bacterium]
MSNVSQADPFRADILVVDDVPANLTLLTGLLKENGYHVRPVPSGKLALNAVERDPPDLILLDINMPGMDGYEVCQRIKAKESTRDIPIIFLTAKAEVEDEARGLALGAVDYITKPVNPTIVRARVKVQIELKQLRDREREYLKMIQNEKMKSETLLTNVLPETVANRLKKSPGIIAESYEQATVLFADLVGFTKMSERISASRLVEILNDLFSMFDLLVEKYGLEKIKTIGDAYMAVNGVPNSVHQPRAAADLALAMLEEIDSYAGKYEEKLQIRVGLHTGPVMAGVIGHKRLVFDLWGDTVNTASRMESHSLPGHIQVSGCVYQQLRDAYDFENRGAMHIKGKGEMVTYFLLGKKGSKRGLEVQTNINNMGRARYNLNRAKKELNALPLSNDLTGVRSQYGFVAVAEQQLILAQRVKRNLLILLVCLKNWESLLRSYEVELIDNAVKVLGQKLYSIYRSSDLVGRLGENLFLVFGMEGEQRSPNALSHRLERGWSDIINAWPVSGNPEVFVAEAVWHHESPSSIEETLSQLETNLRPLNPKEGTSYS